MGSNITAIIKPTHECNLSCKYCCVEKSAEQGRMTSATLEKVIQQIMTLPGREWIHWIWHGGEPALMGVDFFEEAVKLQSRYQNGHHLRNGIQSNATLIDDKFLDFLMDNYFTITSSIDGPEELHNLTRIYPDGRGSFKDAWKGIQRIREKMKEMAIDGNNGSSHMGIICVLSRKNITKLDQVYQFFRENNVSVKMNPLIPAGRAVDDLTGLGIGPAEYGSALVRLFETWFYEPEVGIDVNPLSDALRSCLTNTSAGCQFSGSCRDSFISIGPKGDVYPCGRFNGSKDFWLGNIHEENLKDILKSRKHLEMGERCKTIDDECSACDYLDVCGSGCMYNAYIGNGSLSKKDPYCASYKLLFERIAEAIRSELDEAERKKDEGCCRKSTEGA
jgi:uncharacterized protein